MQVCPFMPSAGTGQNVTAGAAAAVDLRAGDLTVVVYNKDATEIAHVRLGTGDATAADMIVPPSKFVCLAKGDQVVRLSYFSTGTPDLFIITGNGWLSN